MIPFVFATRISSRRGVALLIVVVLVMLVAMGAYRFSFVMESEYRVTRVFEEQAQASLMATSGLELAAFTLEQSLSERLSNGSFENSATWYRHSLEEESDLSNSIAEENLAWRFALISPTPSESENAQTSNRIVKDDSDDSHSQWRWGMMNESAKLHIPTLIQWNQKQPDLARTALLRIPGMDEETADTWLAQNGIPTGEARLAGTTLPDSSFDSEFKREKENRLQFLWYGGDLNQNYQLDPIEVQLSGKLVKMSGPSRVPITSTSQSDASLRPWNRYLTWHSGQRNETSDGRMRINLNDPNLSLLHQKLLAVWPPSWANFVIAVRQHGLIPSPSSNPPSNSIGTRNSVAGNSPTSRRRSSRTGSSPSSGGAGTNASSLGSGLAAIEYIPTFERPAVYTIQSLLDLVDAQVNLAPSSGGPPGNPPIPPTSGPNGSASLPQKMLRSPFTSDTADLLNYLGKLLDEATLDSAPFHIGRVDVSEAPLEVLSSIPGIDTSLAQRILEKRPSNDPRRETSQNRSTSNDGETKGTIAWLLIEGIVDISKLKELQPFIAGRSDVYSVQSIGFRDERSPVHRVTATIDALQIPATLRNRQVWHPWDRGFRIQTLNESLP